MPKVVDHDVRREEIARAFFRVVLEKGIEGATTREIAREAGVSLGVLAHYFGDKDRLISAAFDVLVAQFTRRLSAAAQGRASVAEALEALCLQVLPLDEARRLESGVWLSFWAHGYADAASRTRQGEAYETWIGALAAIIGQLPRARTEAQAREEATALAALLDGLTVQLVLRGSQAFTADQAALLVRRQLEALA